MRGLAAELPQKCSYFLFRWRGKLEYWRDIDIGKTQPRETRAERLSDVVGGGARNFRERSKDRFVIGAGEAMRGEALDDLSAPLMVERGGAKRGEEPSLDFRGR